MPDHNQDNPKQSPPPLDYASPPPSHIQISRGRFYLLLALALTSPVLILVFLLWPSSSPVPTGVVIRARHPGKVTALPHPTPPPPPEHVPNVKMELAALKSALTFTAPADQIIYEEDPIGAAKLLHDHPDQYHITYHSDAGEAPSTWQSPVVANDPQIYSKLVDDRPGWGDNLVFLHQRQAHGSKPVLLAVHLYSSQGFENSSRADGKIYTQQKTRILKVWTYELNEGIVPTKPLREDNLILQLPDSDPHEMAVVRPQGSAEKPELDYGHTLRLYAGQRDPSDPARFSIAYQLDNQPGVIDGYVTPAGVQLIPRQGHLVPGKSIPTWDFDLKSP